MSEARDLNDLLLDGQLPADPADVSIAVPADVEVRRATMRLVSSQVDDGALPLPTDVHAESALLGALLWAGAYAPKELHVGMVADLLEPPMLFTPGHRATYEIIRERYDAGQPVDAISVHSALVAKSRQKLANLEYLEQLVANSQPTTEVQLRARAEAIRDAWARRRLIEVARELDGLARAGKVTAPEAIAKTRDAVEELDRAVVASSNVVSIKQVSREVFEGLLAADPPVKATGFQGIDALLGGLSMPEVTIVGARTSGGKSVFATQAAVGFVDENPDMVAAYISLEMPAKDFVLRTASGLAHVDFTKARRKLTNAYELQRLIAATTELAKKQIYFADALTQTCMGITGVAQNVAIRAMRDGKKLGLIVVDHLHLVRASAMEARMPREQFMGCVSRWLVYLAKRFTCAVVGLAQVNREAEKQGKDTTPQIHHLRESGSFEQDADNIILIHRPRKQTGGFADEPAKIILGKGRNNPAGTRIEMAAEMHFGRFSPIDDPLAPVSRRWVDTSGQDYGQSWSPGEA